MSDADAHLFAALGGEIVKHGGRYHATLFNVLYEAATAREAIGCACREYRGIGATVPAEIVGELTDAGVDMSGAVISALNKLVEQVKRESHATHQCKVCRSKWVLEKYGWSPISVGKDCCTIKNLMPLHEAI